jgi:hypothetical protein
MFQLLPPHADYAEARDAVVTNIMLLTGDLQFAERVSREPETVAEMKKLFRAGMSPRNCAMVITGTALAHAIEENFTSQEHQRVFFTESSGIPSRYSLITTIRCMCDRIERWRRSGSVDGNTAQCICKQVFDALRSKSEYWARGSLVTSEVVHLAA